MKSFTWISIGILLAVLHEGIATGCQDEFDWCPSQRHLCGLGSSIDNTCPETCGVCDRPDPFGCRSFGCGHNCTVDDNSRITCTCRLGYRLDENMRTCSDINECDIPNICSDPTPICRNTLGSYICDGCQAIPGRAHVNYYRSSECCALTSNLSTCGQNMVTGVKGTAGPDAILDLWPWTVLLLIGSRPCTGTLISDEWILTAAHCFSSWSASSSTIMARVALRSTYRNDSNYLTEEIVVDQVIRHENYAFPDNDIALVHLERRVGMTAKTRPICLPSGEVPQEGGRCFLSGYEALYYEDGVERMLKDSGMTLTPKSSCSNNLGRLGRRMDVNNMLCAEYDNSRRGECPGETGGPLVCQRCNSCDWYIAGVMAFGDVCPESESYGAFVSVESYEEWIAENSNIEIRKDGSCARQVIGWRPWGAWTSCSRSCGGGRRLRSRDCYNGVVGDINCSGNANQSQSCNLRECPRWTDYTSWSTCSRSCGRGTRYRGRSCLGGSPGQDGCIGSSRMTESCDGDECPRWSRWSTWSDCGTSCGVPRRKLATRSCINGTVGQNGCIGRYRRFRDCTIIPCPEWSSWSSCSVTCGEGVSRSTRECNDDYGCGGESERTRSCTQDACPSCTNWGSWSACSDSCGGGVMTRDRVCFSDSHSLDEQENDVCNTEPCTGWEPWADWSGCSATCYGYRIRKRTCLGGDCPGSRLDSEQCNHSCHGWSNWGSWSSCSVTCGRGHKDRRRICIGSSRTCPGSANQRERCEEFACQNDFTPWSEWSDCSPACGLGDQYRDRQCRTGDGCLMDATSGNNDTEQVRDCFGTLCPRSMESYTEWSDCSVTCGVGSHQRSTICAGDDHSCTPRTETENCEVAPCPAPYWSDWSQLFECDVTCGNGTVIMERRCINGDTCEGDSTDVQVCMNSPCPTEEPCTDNIAWKYVCPYARSLCASEGIRSNCRKTCQDC